MTKDKTKIRKQITIKTLTTMKKYLLFIISMLCVSIGAWADTTVDIRTSGSTTTITITGDGTGTVTFAEGCEYLPATAVNTVVTGSLTEAVWTEIMANKGGWNTQAANGQVIDLKGVTGLTTSELLNVGMFSSINGTNNTNYIILPTDSDVPTALQTKSNTTPSFDNWDSLKYFIIPQTDGSCKVVIVDLDGQSISDYTTSIISHLVLGTSIKKVEVLAITNDDQNSATIADKEAVEAALVNAGYELKQAALTVDGCAVTVNMNGAEAGQTLANLIATAKAAVIAGGETGICTLIVTGPVTNNDLIALGGTNMTGATRIDLSNATLGSGVTIENILLPTSLTSLILPKGLTVSVGLKSKLTAATNLKYAYSPSTGTTGVSPDTETISVADYVWVNSTGGLDLALTNEATLNDSKYVKVVSDVALSATDITFNTSGRLPNVKYFDMRNANMDASLAAASFSSPNSTDYRIILPDNWSTEQISAFASHLGDVFWTMAAIYSYSGTTLKIYEATDTKYMSDALSNHRIVVDGTTAIEVVGTTLGTRLLTALNGADSDVKTITISASSINELTFTNPNITTLNVTGLNRNTAQLNVDECTALKNLNVTGSAISSVDASVTSLEAVNLNGSTIYNNVDLSGSGLKTLTTNSETWIQGDLHLESTESFTSFASTAKLGTNSSNGNIYLNASGVSTVDLQSVQFQNTSSKIHIDSTAGEGDTPLTNLNADGQLTIYIPTEFDRNRLHPYSSETLDDNIAELAASGAFTLDDGCKIDYDATTGIATVTALHPGCLKTLMENNDNYGKFVDGAIFTFDASCKLNADDLAALAGKDDYGNFNWNFVDLYDLPVSYEHESVTYTYDDIITEAINILRTKNWQYKGLLLPKTTHLGTTLIMDRAEDGTKLATCSQSIAYSGTIGTGENSKVLTASYIYKAADDYGIDYQARLLNLEKMMDLHDEIVTKTQYYSVSTNSATPLDLSTIPATATVNESTINTSKLETVNNDMVTSTSNKPSIYAYPAYEGVMLDVMTSSGIGNTTNLELLMVDGPLTAGDIASVNSFTDGPRVLDLREAEVDGGITKVMLESITNANIEYIILPEGMTKDVVCGAKYSSSMTNLKAVISSTSTNLVAYVNTPGSLAEARYYATGGTTDGTIFNPTLIGLQSVTLAGNLNASDIAANTTTHFLDENGNWKTTSGNLKSVALWGEQGTITTIDLKDAVFAEQTDMNFSYAGLASLHDIILPTSNEMTLIPAECFMGITTFNDLCIPYNYTKIDNAALLNAYCGHITTTDANGALIDNGEHSYTFSANLEEIGTKPATPDANGVYSLDRVVFPQNRGVTDVYVLAHEVPKCYANAFPANMLYGWGGFKGGDFPYCREKYDNSADGSMIFTVLHFPDEASWDKASDKTGSSYEDMEKLYTDINKVYTKKEQTGAVDANGDPVAWPTFAELRRAYNQGTDGITWNDWTLDLDGNGEVLGGSYIPTNKSAIAAGPGTNTYDFSNYEGWHQFVLSMATYVEPAKTVENEIIKTDYVQGAWYTLCIPFSLTVDQAVELLGIPMSVENETENTLNGTVVTQDKLPDVRTLQTVTRTPGTTNTVTMKFTQDLLSNGITRYWNINISDPDQSAYSSTGSTSDGDAIAIRGGYPYLVKPYLPANAVVNNLGKYIMTRYGNKFEQARSCIYIDGCAQDLATYSSSQKTGRFAKPFEGHKIQAVWDDNDSSTPKYRTHSDGKNYNYTFVGQFWDQKLPRYCFYMVENSSNTAGKWYRLASDKSYKWNQYKCIIMVTPEVEDAAPDGRSYLYENSGKFRNNNQTLTTHSIYPASTGTDAQGAYKFTDHLYIEFLNGLDDANFEEPAGPAAARYVITFDDFIQELDEDGNSTTAIESLDGEPINKMPTDGKVYNLSGQLVGNSIDGLEKGMYIVNGKKYIVR